MKYKFGIFVVTAVAGLLPITGCVHSHRGATVYEPTSRVVVSEAPVPSTTRRIIVTEAPPAPRREVMTRAPSGSHVWVSGYWTHTGTRYVWVPGHWELRPRTTAVWVPGQWDKNPDGKGWIWTPGHWQ